MSQDEKHDDEDFFQLLRHYHRQGAVLCCGGVKEAGQQQGLVPKHAFSLLQVRAVPLNWHSNEYFRMVPWLCVSRTCGLLQFAFWGLRFASFDSALMCTDMQWKFRFDRAFLDLYGSLWSHVALLRSNALKVQIRNPWGTGEWKGSWCDGSPLWDAWWRPRLRLDAVMLS